MINVADISTTVLMIRDKSTVVMIVVEWLIKIATLMIND